VWGLAFAAAAFAAPYVLKHPAHAHCKPHYTKKTRTVKVHGHKLKQTICVYAAPKSGSGTTLAPHIQFTLTNHEGWEYAGILEFPHDQVTFSSDVSSSPPGYAKLVLTLTGASGNLEFPDLNAGRPNGPRLEIETGRLVYPVEHSLVTTQGESLVGPCEWAGTSTDVTPEHESPFSLELRCWLLPPADTEMNGDAPEAEVQTLATELQHATPWYEFGFKFPGEAADTGQCDFYVAPTGQIRDAAEFARFGCEPAHISVVR
jgi:hypothetical protein